MKKKDNLQEFIKGATSAFHTVSATENIFKSEGFVQLDLAQEKWDLNICDKYYIKLYDSSILAFAPHRNIRKNMRIAAAHTDFPCLKIKPNSLIIKEGYGKVNVEIYGGMILATWLDRPLSLAGKVVLASEDVFNPEERLVDFKRPIAVIPSLAIHQNRKVNEGIALNRQKEMLPLIMVDEEAKADLTLEMLLAKELKCKPEAILSYELNFYQWEKGVEVGVNNEILVCPRLDNLTSVKACIEGIVNCNHNEGLDVVVLFDNEEVGSRTKQGAGSVLLMNVLERIYKVFKQERTTLLADIHKGLMLSMDAAHALHPNFPETTDITNHPIMNKGIAIKQAANQAYASDARGIAIVKGLCKLHGIPCQSFVNNSNIPGGSTLGSIASTLLPMPIVDIGVPMLGMHSAVETMGVKDQESLEKLAIAFFKELEIEY